MSLESNFCRGCACRGNLNTCQLCIAWNYQCPGTCGCCTEDEQEVIISISPTIAERARRSKKSVYCTHCHCRNNGFACRTCVSRKAPCPGTCRCCEEARNVIEQRKKSQRTVVKLSNKKKEILVEVNKNASTGEDERLPALLSPASTQPSSASTRASLNSNTPSSTEVTREMITNKRPVPYCSHCSCYYNSFACFKCATGKYSCPGICVCCEEYRTKKKLKKSKGARLSKGKREVLKEVTNKNVLSEKNEVINTSSSVISTTESFTLTSPSYIEFDTHIKAACREVHCSQYDCEGMGAPPCRICLSSKNKCSGTCGCCSGHGTESQVAEFAPDEEEICPRCNCIRGRQPCNNCSIWDYTCSGDCLCCIKYTVKLSISRPIQPLDRFYCPRCRCERGRDPCYECQMCNYRCLGVCHCCTTHRLKRSTPSSEIEIDNANIERYCPRCQRELDKGSCIECPYASPLRPRLVNIKDVPKEVKFLISEKERRFILLITQKNNEKIEVELNKSTVERISEDLANFERSTSWPGRNVQSPDRMIRQNSLLSSALIHNMTKGSIPKMANYNSSISTPLDLESNAINLPPVQHDGYGGAAYLNKSEQSTQSPCKSSQSGLKQSSVKCIFPTVKYYCNYCECIRGKEPCETCIRIDLQCFGRCKCCQKFNRYSFDLLQDISDFDTLEPTYNACGFPMYNPIEDA